MDWKKEWRPLAVIVTAFLACFYLPVASPRFGNAVMEALYLVKGYARQHVLLCLVPAFFIAGAVAVFVSQASVMKYLGANAPKVLAYGVASVSGTILAVCSCTVLPLFAGIYRMGAGLGPATTFLYSGPSINVLAIILTARILGIELGIARAVGAIVFSIVIGLAMHFMFRGEERSKIAAAPMAGQETMRSLWQNGLYFAAMVAIMVFANWGEPNDQVGLWHTIYSWRWLFSGFSGATLGLFLILWFNVRWWKIVLAAVTVIGVSLLARDNPLIPFTVGILCLSVIANTQKGEMEEWFSSSWGVARQIFPLLLVGVFVAGLMLGRSGEEGLIPSEWISRLVGGNSLRANLFASVVGAFMYFATLTEVPILQGLIGNGMGKGPALALLLAGPALSLPNMLVIHSVLGSRKTITYVGLVVVMATATGTLYGAILP
ncbi:permease [Candidatus Hydrogenedentota bacterium]